MSAAFDDNLINAVVTVVSTEARAFNDANRFGLDYWTPNIKPYKDPRWGRGQETPGEDPYHIRSYGASLLDGLQGESWHGTLRYEFDAQVTSQDLAEYYMPASQTCARDAKVGSIMCSYNSLNGVLTCLDPYLLQDILRDHWNWIAPENYVTSDCDAIESAYGYHHYDGTREQTVADTLVAGTDLNCGTYYQSHLPAAFSSNLFNQSTVDTAVTRLYSALVQLGCFDSSNSICNITAAAVATPESFALALRAAEEGIVLFKNDGVLPLTSSNGTNTTIASIGDWANATTTMQGNYYGVAPFLHSPLYAMQQLSGVEIIYGGTGGDPTTDGWTKAYNAALAADIIIYADGTTTTDAEEGHDRDLINWTGAEVDLVSWLTGLGKSTIVLSMGDQLDAAPFLSNSNISAMLLGGYPGQDGDTALVNILTRKTAPAGRLLVTNYPANYVNEVSMLDMNLT